MIDYYRDTWNDADQQVISSEDHYSEMQYLEDKVKDLEQQVQEMADDEVYILSEILFVRDHYSDDKDLYGWLTSIIDLHSKEVKQKAVDKLLKMYPKRHWGEF